MNQAVSAQTSGARIAHPRTARVGPVRVATFNTGGIGAVGTTKFDDQVAVVRRIGADIIALQEVTESAAIEEFVASSAYAYWAEAAAKISPHIGFIHAFLSRWPITHTAIYSPFDLSGDPLAEDLQKYILRADVETPQGTFQCLSFHHISGISDDGEGRRQVESVRVNQAAALCDATKRIIVMGDANEDVNTPATLPRAPTPFQNGDFSWIPSPGTPPAPLVFGSDVQAVLDGAGYENDPFLHMLDSSYTNATPSNGTGLLRRVPADTQLGGQLGSFWNPGGGFWNLKDYIFVGGPGDFDPTAADAEIYNSENEGLGGLAKVGDELASGVSLNASDHMPVFCDIEVIQ